MKQNISDRISFVFLFLTIILLPLFFLPFTNIPVEISKGLLLVSGLTLTAILWAAARFFDGKIEVPRSSLLFTGFIIVLVMLASALFSAHPQASLFGTMFDLGSFWFLFAAFALMLFSAIFFRTSGQARTLLFAMVVSAAALLIFQTARIFAPEVLSLGVLGGKTGNILGSWNALGLFSGFAALMFLLAMDFFPISRGGKFLLGILLLLSLLLCAAVNFPVSWILLGIASLILFVYKASLSLRSTESDNTERRFPLMSFVVVLVSLLFIVSGQFVGTYLPNKLGLQNAEVNPSFDATVTVAKSVIAQDPVLGIGPNSFSEAWSLYKPITVNNTIFWDVAFESGSGLWPTLVATTGILGLLSWLLFFVLFLWHGAKSVFGTIRDGANWEVVAFFVLSLYLYITLFMYTGGAALLLLTFALSGVFIGLSSASRNKVFEFSFLGDHRKGFFAMLLLIVLILATVVLGFKYYERFASVVHLRRALMSQDIPTAEKHIGRAVALHPNDTYLRAYSQIYAFKLRTLTASKTETPDKEELQDALDQTLRSAELAVNYNPKNYLNLTLLGSVYETAGSLGADGAYEQALNAYEKASLLNPSNPVLKVAQARTELARGNRKSALTYAEAALKLAPFDEGLKKYVDSLRQGQSVQPPPELTPEAETAN